VLAGKISDPSYFDGIKNHIMDSGAKDNFCLLPELPPAIIHSIFAISSYAVPVSINEGYGRVAAEAIQHNIPVLAAKDSGYKDIVADGKTGLLVNPLDENSIYRGLHRISARDFEKNLNITDTDYQSTYLASLKKLYSRLC
jgi:glycosyltransferase involved in cell wall biosynthesis